MRELGRCICCFENAKDSHYGGGVNCRDYNRQVVFNKRMTRIFTKPAIPWHLQPVPQASYRAPKYPLPVQAPEVKAFYQALEPLGDWQRDVTNTSHVGACMECLYTEHFGPTTREVVRPNGGWHSNKEHNSARLAPLPHTCGKAIAAPKRARRARKAA